MRILVTGASGFIGKHVVAALVKTGHTIIVTARSDKKIKEQPWFSSVLFIPFDIDDSNDEGNTFRYFHQPDLLIHLAWDGLNNFKSNIHFESILPKHYFFLKNYILGGGTHIVVTGTCLEYGIVEGCLHESMVTNPICSYGLAKDTLRKYLEQFNREYPFLLQWIRLFYTYGEGQNLKAILPQLQAALSRKEVDFNMSGGEQIRDYTAVYELAGYIVSIGLQTAESGIFNCCSGIPVSVRKLVEDYLAEHNQRIRLNLGYYPYPDYEPFAFWGNKSRLNKILNKREDH